MEQQSTWGELFRTLASNPAQFLQTHWHWLLGVLILLFALSKLNNYLEVKGVNKAIYLTRGFVGLIMAFLITPIAFLLLVNFIAYMNGLPLIDMWRFWDWFLLSWTSFWWLVECIFDFGEPRDHEVPFTVSSAVRVLWLALPILFIWMRTAKNRFWRLMYLPFFASMMVFTAYRAAEPTFLDHHVPPSWQTTITEGKPPVAPDFMKDKTAEELTEQAGDFYSRYRKMILLGLLLLVLGGLAAGQFSQYKVYGLLVAVIGIAGIYYIYTTGDSTVKAPKKEIKEEVTYVELNQLYEDFEQLYVKQRGKPSVELTELAFEIEKQLRAKKEQPPKVFCERFRDYFFDFCD